MPANYRLIIKNALAAVIFCCCFCTFSLAQEINGEKNAILKINFTDKDSFLVQQELKMQTTFKTLEDLNKYVEKIPGLFASKGYPFASVDSISLQGNVISIAVYIGEKFRLIQLRTDSIEKAALNDIGYNEKTYLNKPFDFLQLQTLQQRLLAYYEKTGYPFASVYLDNISIDKDHVTADLRSDKSVLYHIDSIRVYGKVHLRKKFLQRYLEIQNGSVYNKNTLALVDKRISELNYISQVQPSDITMLGLGSVLNLYLETKPSSQVNFLIGFLPGSSIDKKTQVTGDVNLDLKNILGGGESILLKWQQLQRKSPRLNIGLNQPYIFNSPFGFNFLFDLFKKDSSFLQLNAQLGVQYALTALQSGTLFLQFQNSGLLAGGIDTTSIKSLKRLPDNIDVRTINTGITYDFTNTNYRLNPREGNDLSLTASIGLKNIRQNNEITSLKDPSFNYASLYDSLNNRTYQLKCKIYGAHYFPVSKFTTLKTSLTGAAIFSPNIFRNELYQIGGFKLLRGFDEESIYAARYLVGSLEYRLLVNTNSYFFFFADGGIVKNKYQFVNDRNNFISTGLGLVYETKLGLLNISYALGKRDDVKFNLSQASKLHFGYVNYF